MLSDAYCAVMLRALDVEMPPGPQASIHPPEARINRHVSRRPISNSFHENRQQYQGCLVGVLWTPGPWAGSLEHHVGVTAHCHGALASHAVDLLQIVAVPDQAVEDPRI